jgi:hypothetical protein
MNPLVRRSWAPRAHTPVLMPRGRYRINVSVIAALVITPRRRVRAYFSLLAGESFDGERILPFLKQLCRQLRVPIELVWDRLNAHRGQPVKGWLERNPHRVDLGLCQDQLLGQLHPARTRRTHRPDPHRHPDHPFRSRPTRILRPALCPFFSPKIGHYLCRKH